LKYLRAPKAQASFGVLKLERESSRRRAVGMWKSHGDFQGRWERWETAVWFSKVSTDRHFHRGLRNLFPGSAADSNIALSDNHVFQPHPDASVSAPRTAVENLCGFSGSAGRLYRFAL